MRTYFFLVLSIKYILLLHFNKHSYVFNNCISIHIDDIKPDPQARRQFIHSKEHYIVTAGIDNSSVVPASANYYNLVAAVGFNQAKELTGPLSVVVTSCCENGRRGC